jgi:hypothetical protein
VPPGALTTAQRPRRTGPRTWSGSPSVLGVLRLGGRRWGTTVRPPFATAAIMAAIWSGVVSTGPWPIETEIVSPGYQGCLRAVRLQAASGTRPRLFALELDPGGRPRPKIRE